MPHSARPTHAQITELMHLMIDVAALKANPPAQRQLLVDGLTRLLRISQGLFLVGEDWRPGGRPRFSLQTMSSEWDPLYVRYLREHSAQGRMEADAFCDYSIHDPSPVQSYSFARVLPDRQSRKKYPTFSECREVGRVAEGIASYVRLDGNRVFAIGLHPFGGDRSPTPRDRALALLAAREIERLIRRGHMPLPPIPSQGLAARLRQVMDHLLAGKSPKRIAFELELSLWTVRDHIQRIYRHYGVSGREELTARFVRS